jgi:hypothetical protein
MPDRGRVVRVSFSPLSGDATEGRCRVGIIFPFPGLDSVPCLLAAIDLLCESGFEVDVLIPAGSPPDASAWPYFSHTEALSARFANTEVTGPGLAARISNAVSRPIRQLRLRLRGHQTVLQGCGEATGATTPYACLIGVDPEGLVEAQACSKRWGVPYLYWSLEILVGEDAGSRRFRRLKRREVMANQGATITIVQDKDRAALLASQNAIPDRQLALVPNSFRGHARRAKASFAHEQFGIPPDRKIVLCAGSVAPWAMSEEIVHSANGWSGDLVLLMHSRFDWDHFPLARKVMAQADPDKVRFSSHPLMPLEYEALVDSADIGLALYQPQSTGRYNQSNIRVLGLSSGKLAAFLRAGLPVIVSNLKGPADLVEKYSCGAVVDRPGELPQALRLVWGRYEEFSANSIRAFEGSLDFDRSFRPVLEAIRSCAGDGS